MKPGGEDFGRKTKMEPLGLGFGRAIGNGTQGGWAEVVEWWLIRQWWWWGDAWVRVNNI
jgi:hypothetical protein